MYKNILRGFLIGGGIYLFLEAVLYLFNIRLYSVETVWPDSAVSYARLINQFLGSCFLFMVILAFEVQKNIEKYQPVIKTSGLWALFYGFLLIFISLSKDFSQAFNSLSSLYVWFPFYNQYLLLEAVFLIAYSMVVFLWISKKDGKQ
ncbi:hypothetical protein KKE78_01415 [Patescibacteria group bacterium]|nr:hypothetical protein [Patescibacteria group bacterium]